MDTYTNITKLPSLEAIEQHRADQLENGYLFPLQATSLGMAEPIVVRVRRIGMMDRAAIDQLPTELKDVIFTGIKEFSKMQKDAQQQNTDPQDLIEMMANNTKILTAANAWCQAAFIYPEVKATKAEIDGPDQWYVDAIDPEDRVSVLAISLDSDSAPTKKLKMFRPQRTEHVPDRAIGTVAPAPEQPVGSAVEGV